MTKSKKLTKTEIISLSRVILSEAKELVKVHNETVKNSSGYQTQLQLIKDANPINKFKDEVIKMAKSYFGTNVGEKISFTIPYDFRKESNTKEAEALENLDKTFGIKPLISDSKDKENLEKIQDQLVLGQLDSTNIAVIKASIITSLTK